MSLYITNNRTFIKPLSETPGGEFVVYNTTTGELSFSRQLPTSVESFINTEVTTAIANLVDFAPTSLDTLNELAAALGDDPNFATTITGQLSLKANAADLATVATSGSYTDLTNKPDLSVYQLSANAFSGSYTDLTNKPDLSVYQLSANAFSGAYADLTGKPDLSVYQLSANAFSGAYADLTGKPDLSVYQLSANAFSGDYTDLTNTPTIPSNLDDLSDVSVASANSGDMLKFISGVGWIPAPLAIVATTGSYNNLTDKPTLFSGSYTDLTNKPDLSVYQLTANAFSGNYDDLANKPVIPEGADLTGYATETYVNTSISNLVNGADAAYDTLKEIQDAMATDAELAAAISGLTIGNATQTVTAGTGLTGGGSFTANQTSDSSVTLSLDGTGTIGAGTYGNTADSTKIDTITVDAYGRITAIATGATGDIGGVTAGNGLTGGGTAGTVTLTVGAGAYIIVNPTDVAVDATDANTASKVVARDASGNFSAGTITAELSGNATTATSAGKWTTARTITLGGDLTGNVSIDGSGDVTLTAAVVDDSHNHIISNVDGLQTALDGKASTSHTHTLSNITDVDVSSAVNGDFLYYNSATSKWSKTSSVSYVSSHLNVTGTVGLSNTGVNFNNYGGRSNYGLYMPNTTDVAIKVNGTDRITATASGAAVTGDITATGEITAYASDARLKTNVEAIANPIEKIQAIRGVTYEWNELGQELGLGTEQNVGVIAQEVEAVLPQLVVESAHEGYKTVKYDKLTALLIEAVKAQQQQIDSLKAEIASLKNSKSI